MVFLIEFPIETESPLVLWEDCTPKMSDRCYSELWCGGVVAQMQSIQQTGFLGIRQGVKKTPFALLLDWPVFSLSDFCWVTHMEKPVAVCVTPQGSDSKRCFLYPPILPSVHCHLKSWEEKEMPCFPHPHPSTSVRPTRQFCIPHILPCPSADPAHLLLPD